MHSISHQLWALLTLTSKDIYCLVTRFKFDQHPIFKRKKIRQRKIKRDRDSRKKNGVFMTYIKQISYLVTSIISQTLAPKPPTLKTCDSLGFHQAWEKEEADRRTVHSSSLANEHLQDTFPPSPRKKIKTKHITLRFKIVHITNTEMQRMLFLLPVRKTCSSI